MTDATPACSHWLYRYPALLRRRAQQGLLSLTLSPPCPFLQIVNEYGKDCIVTDVLNAVDIFMEIVSNPDGFAYSHSMVRVPEREGVKDQGSALGEWRKGHCGFGMLG